MRSSHQREEAGKYQRAALEPKLRCGGYEVAQRGAKRVGNQNRQPVEDFFLPGGYILELDPAGGAMPDKENSKHTAEQNDGRFHIAEIERAIQVIRHRRSYCRGGYYDRPVGEW